MEKKKPALKNKDRMGSKSIVALLSVLLLLESIVDAGSLSDVQTSIGVFDVTKFGDSVNGELEISQALLSAWKEACASTSPSKVVIPEGLYMLNQVTLEGPCNAAIEVQVLGILQAPADLTQFKPDAAWITFQRINQFALAGTGTFDGRGSTTWTKHNCAKSGKCTNLPENILLNSVSNGIIQEISSEDSKSSHIRLSGCTNLVFQDIFMSSPEHCANSDGIRIAQSTGIQVTGSRIATGGDCVSIYGGSKQINVTKVTCGPGRGIGVGTLGKNGSEEPVVGVSVKNCTLGNTSNGVRITSVPASPAGVASGIQFLDIIMKNVSNPIVIDEEYCPNNQCKEQSPSLVKISYVCFKNIHGTSATPLAVKLACSSKIPCQEVDIGDIDLTHNGKAATAECSNVKPKTSGKLNFPACGSSK